MTHLRSLFRRAFLVLVISLAAGCSTVTIAPDPLKTPPKSGEGTVVVSVTGNTAQVAAFDTVSVRRILPADTNVRENHVLNQVVPGLARDTSLFIGVLPEGEYE